MMSFLLACLIALQLSDGTADVGEITRRAVQATQAARESVARAKGAGHFSYKRNTLVDGAITVHYEVAGRVTFAYSGERSFIKFANSPDEDWRAQIFILDGHAMLSSAFSPDLPQGAKGWIDNIRHGMGVTDKHGIAPHFLFEAATYIENPGNEWAVTLESTDKLYIVKHARGNTLRKFVVDPDTGYHIVRFELFMDERLRSVVDKVWGKDDAGLWYVTEYLYEMLPKTEGDGGYAWQFHFDSFELNADIPDQVFTVDALGLPADAAIYDMRSSPPEQIGLRPEQTDVATIERIVGELPEVVVRSSRRTTTPTAWPRLRIWLVVVNVGLILILAGFLLRRGIRSHRASGSS